MKIHIKLNDGAVLPANAHESDTGYDLVAASGPNIVGEKDGEYWRSIQYIEYDTGIQISPENIVFNGFYSRPGYLDIYSRSSISKTNLVLANGVGICDNSYRGNIKLRFKYIWQPEDINYDEIVLTSGHRSTLSRWSPNMERIYRQGDKIGQLIAKWKESIQWEIVDSLDDTGRASGGFGSTDKPLNAEKIAGNYGSGS